jgi:L-2-amino-thiazoline-4-carboxylic acid hydrolase
MKRQRLPRQKDPDGEISGVSGVSQLIKREIQAPLVAALFRVFARECGEQRALVLMREAIEADARAAGEELRCRFGGNELKDLRQVIETLWCAEQALSIHWRVETEAELCFEVRCCRYVELYERLGLRDLGFCLSCSRDAAFAAGFNPSLRLERTGTLMEGAGCCDFRFVFADRD